MAANHPTTYYPLRTVRLDSHRVVGAAPLTAASRLVATDWTNDLSVVLTITVLGLMAGLAFGQSRFFPANDFLFRFRIFGLFTVFWQLGATNRPKRFWSDRLSGLLLRLGIIIYQLVNKLAIRDSLLFLVLMGFLFWGLASHAGYILVRYGDAWKATLPTGLAIVCHPLLRSNRHPPGLVIGFYIFLHPDARGAHDVYPPARPLAGQPYFIAAPPQPGLYPLYDVLRLADRGRRLDDSGPGQGRAGGEKLWQPVRTSWNSAVDDMNYAFASLRSTRPVYSTVYGNNATLGRGTPLGPGQVFTGRTPLDVPTGVRYYWRARTFDTYHDGQWFSTIDASHDFHPENNDLTTSTGIGRLKAISRSPASVNMGTLFYPGTAVMAELHEQSGLCRKPGRNPGYLHLHRRSILTAWRDLSGEIFRQRAQRYRAAPGRRGLSRLGNRTIPPAAREYFCRDTDSWQRKLLPRLETPYDKAAAITEYLRKNITYVETIDGQPQPGQEVIDWFLFDYRKGFCNYFATAEVILLRLAGVPAHAGRSATPRVS